jgi:hypothetical protein
VTLTRDWFVISTHISGDKPKEVDDSASDGGTHDLLTFGGDPITMGVGDLGFLDLIARRYGSGMNVVDFRHHAEDARVSINLWVEDRTRRWIRDLIPSGSLNADTRFVLVNAVYFKGMWVLRFRKAATRDEPFWLDDAKTVHVPLSSVQIHVANRQSQ